VKVLLADCRPRDAYLAGHLPGAVSLDPETDLTGEIGDASRGRHPLPETDALAATFGRAGIEAHTFVLAYDEGSGWAARCWWLLRHLGHDLAGTFDARGYTGPHESGEGSAVPALFSPRERSDDLIGAAEILERLNDPTLVLLDARAPERWRGDTEPLDPVAGRIPGACNAPSDLPLPAAALDAPELVAYCGSGVTAAIVVQKAVLAGRGDIRLYAGSFSEWCRRPGYPIETGYPIEKGA
jgi:thiosulfate/3-mercaptopyruvate sulfurtransferase